MASPIELQAPDLCQEGVAQECHNLEWPAKRAFDVDDFEKSVKYLVTTPFYVKHPISHYILPSFRFIFVFYLTLHACYLCGLESH